MSETMLAEPTSTTDPESESQALLREAENLLLCAAHCCINEADCQAVMLATNPSSEAAAIARSKFVELRRGPKGGV